LLAAGRTDDMARYLDSALASTERAAKLARRLLDFSREKPQATQPVTMSRLIGDLMELLRQSVGAGIDLQVKEYSAWPVSIDASQFENVLLNFCINARDAMAGCGTIVIETHDTRLAEPAAAIQNLACGD